MGSLLRIILQSTMNDLFAGTKHSLKKAWRRLADTEPESTPPTIIFKHEEEVATPPFDESLVEGIWHRPFRARVSNRFSTVPETAGVEGKERDQAEVNLKNGYTLYLLRHSYGWSASFRGPGEGNVPTTPIHKMGAMKKPRVYPKTVEEAIRRWAGFLS